MKNIKDFTPEEIQKTKDFIWDNLKLPSKEVVGLIATTNALEERKMSVKGLSIGVDFHDIPESPKKHSKNKKPSRLPFPTYAQQMETLNGIGQMLNSYKGFNPWKL